jgi:hypothetical protein
MPRSTNSHELSFRSRLGKAAAIGGLKRVEQEVARTLPIVLGAGLDADTVSRMLKTFRTIADRCERSPAAHPSPSPDRRVKVRWTPERIAQFKREALWCKDNRALARKLGLPAFCEGAMRAARSRYGVAATHQAGRKHEICPPAPVLREAPDPGTSPPDRLVQFRRLGCAPSRAPAARCVNSYRRCSCNLSVRPALWSQRPAFDM